MLKIVDALEELSVCLFIVEPVSEEKARKFPRHVSDFTIST
jgi:hypothetical protein